MFLGTYSQGINREVATILESAGRIRTRKGAKTLAIVEASVFAMAEDVGRDSPIENEEPSQEIIARGLLPSLEVLVKRATGPIQLVNATTLCQELQSNQNAALLYGVELVATNRIPDADQYPCATDPYGNDYVCKLCDKELSNQYFHCEGCETLLKKDYNICRDCFDTGAFLRFTEMRDDAPKMFCDYHHTGQTVNFHASNRCSCPCRQGFCLGCKESSSISLCRNCSCKCHKKFSVRYRFRNDEAAIELLWNVKRFAGEEMMPYYRETVERINGVPLAL
jgi:hypothetical protein